MDAGVEKRCGFPYLIKVRFAARRFVVSALTVCTMSSLDVGKVDRLVLGTVNASFRETLDAETLAESVKKADVETWMSHVATFFTEVKPHLILAFAEAHGIAINALIQTYSKIKALTGESNKALDAELSGLEIAS